MTNDTKRHQRELADVGDRLSRRVSVYHMLLAKTAEYLQWEIKTVKSSNPDYLFEWQCPVCAGRGLNEWDIDHRSDCLKVLIERALAADDATLRAMLDELGGGDA